MTEHKILRWAKAYGKAGYNIFPCKPGTKVPLTRNGVLDATHDPEYIEGWFGRREDLNIGLACGPQPNGVNLLAIDVDAHKGGMETWADLMADKPNLGAPWHSTPNGGMHIFFDAPATYRNTRERIGEGIDTRGSGGYVVVPPSSFPVGSPAENRYYETTSDFALVSHRPLLVPAWLAETLVQPQIDPHQPAQRDRMADAPRGDDVSPGDWIRCHGDWPTELTRFGWQHAHGDYWTRPGKNVREGHSAVLHPSGPLVIFTTDVPPELERVGHPTTDRTGIAVSLFELIAAYEFGGDLSAAGREIRRAMPAAPSRGAVVSRPEALPTVEGVPGAGLNLNAEFWEARDVLGHIRQAAQARRVSPDALLINALARSATLIPPSLRLPPVIGKEATFDFLGVVAGETSSGKSIASGVGEDLLPDPGGALLDEDERVYLFDMPIGSGEGLVQAFMVPERKPDENGKIKPTGKQVVGKQALHFTVDEATGLVAQAQRKGTTIIQTLATAWSGKTMGNTNASAETNRLIRGGRVRVAAVLNIQSSNAYMLFTDELTNLGLTSRMLLSSAHDPAAPDERPEWPGLISFPIPAGTQTGTKYMSYAQPILDQLDAERLASLKGGVADKETGHTSLLRCKVASILAVWEGRQHVTVDDWALAGMIMDMSARVLAHLDQLRATQVRNNRETAAVARGESEHVAETVKERRAVDDLAKRIIERTPADGIGRRDLMKSLTATKTRHRFGPALERAIESGHIGLTDGRVVRTS